MLKWYVVALNSCSLGPMRAFPKHICVRYVCSTCRIAAAAAAYTQKRNYKNQKPRHRHTHTNTHRTGIATCAVPNATQQQPTPTAPQFVHLRTNPRGDIYKHTRARIKVQMRRGLNIDLNSTEPLYFPFNRNHCFLTTKTPTKPTTPTRDVRRKRTRNICASTFTSHIA